MEASRDPQHQPLHTDEVKPFYAWLFLFQATCFGVDCNGSQKLISGVAYPFGPTLIDLHPAGKVNKPFRATGIRVEKPLQRRPAL